MNRLAWLALAGAALAALALLVWGRRAPHQWDVMATPAPVGSRVALVRGRECPTPPCQALWIGSADGEPVHVADLAPGIERCTEIAWTPDGARVGFLINGYQLRIYHAETRLPAGQVRLVDPGGDPPERIARGLTFSENGSAVTFDDCPRTRSGCRAGLAAIPRESQD